MAIHQLQKQLGRKTASVEPMLLNKVLANFLYDYPWEANRDLHCLHGVPNDFGALVHVHHRNRCPTPVSFYAASRVSPHYTWDKATRTFSAQPGSDFSDVVRDLFDERQEIPFTTVTTYFRLLAEIYRTFENVDVLNILSIGREQNCLYNHLLYNVRQGFSELAFVNESLSSDATKSRLHEAGKQAASAMDKLQGARSIESWMGKIRQTFANDFEFLTALDTLENNRYPYSSEFRETLRMVDAICSLISLLSNIGLFQKTGAAKYLKQSIAMQGRLSRLSIDNIPQPSAALLEQREFEGVWRLIFPHLDDRMHRLPREEPVLAARIVHDARRRARNIATNYCYKHNLREVSLLYIDFSGLRTIPEPKEEIISEYYRIVEKSASSRNGVKLYGGRDGDDAYTYLFRDPRLAVLCTEDVKREWLESLFLSQTRCDVKFGLSYTSLPEESKEAAILKSWGDAKDMCEFKNGAFKNRGYLLIGKETFETLSQSSHRAIVDMFEKLDFDSNTELMLFRCKNINIFP